MMKRAIITREILESAMKSSSEEEFKTIFSFLKCTNGVRIGELSVLVGPMGNGKSTFLKTIITQLLENKKKVLLRLSEESTNKYFENLILYFADKYGVGRAQEFLENLFLISEIERPVQKFDDFFSELNEMICSESFNYFFFDNVTTSFVESLSISKQGEFYREMKRISSRLSFASFLVVHTVKGTDIYKKAITGEDVRGNLASSNLSSYTYVVNTFFKANPVRAFVTIDKARYHSDANKKTFELFYNKKLGVFSHDSIAESSIIKKIMKALNSLEGRN